MDPTFFKKKMASYESQPFAYLRVIVEYAY